MKNGIKAVTFVHRRWHDLKPQGSSRSCAIAGVFPQIARTFSFKMWSNNRNGRRPRE